LEAEHHKKVKHKRLSLLQFIKYGFMVLEIKEEDGKSLCSSSTLQISKDSQ